MKKKKKYPPDTFIMTIAGSRARQIVARLERSSRHKKERRPP